MKQPLSKLPLVLLIVYFLPQAKAFDETFLSGGATSGHAVSPWDNMVDQPLWLNSFPERVFEFPRTASTGTSHSVGQDLSLTQLLASGDDNQVTLSTGIRHRQLDEEPELPEEFQSALLDPWNVNLGLNYHQPLGEQWKASTGVNVASTSDRPATKFREMNVSLNASLRMPHDERNSWIVTLNYCPATEESLPMPGVAFSYDPTPRFHANIGLPLQTVWRPSEAWEFQFSYMLVHTIHAKTLYKLTDRSSLFAAYDWATETIVLLDAQESNSRLAINDPRVSAGVQASLPWHWTAVTSVGCVFDRYLFDGSSLTRSNVAASDLGNGVFAAINVDLRY